ncbi:MAG: zinc dependent phospholipase C family protein [Thermodesulfobacteriota bacterium]
MAGAFTHFILCDVAKSKRSELGLELWQLLNRHYRFLFLGAASPDLPYLSVRSGRINWADVMHYEKTNSIVETGYAQLKKSFASKSPFAIHPEPVEWIKFVWLMGYVSHLIADATIHPVVEATVGPYEENKGEHRLCELTEDSIIYNIYRRGEIRYSEFSEVIKFCDESRYFVELIDFWTELMLSNYPEKKEEPRPAIWFITYGEAIDAAEGGSQFVALFRHIGLGASLIYKTSEEIEKEYPQDYLKYFKEVRLPGASKGPFKEAAFEKAMDNVISAWKKLYEGLKSEIVVSQIVKNWNLDTGVDMGSGEVTYWA